MRPICVVCLMHEARCEMSALRPAAVAGMFYPEAPDVLASTVHEFLAAPGADPADAPAPKAIIVPHAGFIYSGAIAGAAFARLSGAAGIIRRVLIFGPAHRAWVKGLALPSADAFATPLGSVEV